VRTSRVPVNNSSETAGLASFFDMQLNALLESLETEFEAMQVNAKHTLREVGAIEVSLGNQRRTLRNLVFARKFVMGVSAGSVFVIPASKLQITSFEPGESAKSKQQLQRWLVSAIGLWLTVQSGDRHIRSRLLGVDGGVLILRHCLVSIASIDWLSVDAVENSQPQ